MAKVSFMFWWNSTLYSWHFINLRDQNILTPGQTLRHLLEIKFRLSIISYGICTLLTLIFDWETHTHWKLSRTYYKTEPLHTFLFLSVQVFLESWTQLNSSDRSSSSALFIDQYILMWSNLQRIHWLVRKEKPPFLTAWTFLHVNFKDVINVCSFRVNYLSFCTNYLTSIITFIVIFTKNRSISRHL